MFRFSLSLSHISEIPFFYTLDFQFVQTLLIIYSFIDIGVCIEVDANSQLSFSSMEKLRMRDSGVWDIYVMLRRKHWLFIAQPLSLFLFYNFETFNWFTEKSRSLSNLFFKSCRNLDVSKILRLFLRYVDWFQLFFLR